MRVFRVYVHRDFDLTFKVANGKADCIRGCVFDDVSNPTFYDTEQEAVQAVAGVPLDLRFEQKGDLVTMIYNAAAANQAEIDERGVQIGFSKPIVSNLIDIDKAEALVAERFAK